MTSLVLNWDETRSHVHISVVENSLLQFCLWVFLHLGEPQGPVLGHLLPCTACPSTSPHKWSKNDHKLPLTLTLRLRFRTKESIYLNVQARGVAPCQMTIELPCQHFLRQFKTPSRRHQTAFYIQTQMVMEWSPEWNAKLDPIKSASDHTG